MNMMSGLNGYKILKPCLEKHFNLPENLSGFDLICDSISTLPYMKLCMLSDEGENYSSMQGMNFNYDPKEGNRVLFESLKNIVLMGDNITSYKISCRADELICIDMTCGLEFK